MFIYSLGFGIALASLAQAQFPPKPEGITIVKSKFHEDISISYKEPGICETTPGVKSYSGYIHLPPGTLDEAGERQNYPINTFFWFFEARKDPHNAPLSIWLTGGPGGSSSIGLLQENGPCTVNPDSNSTTLNPWSWNNEVNMLYIDQPNQVGYSYDYLTNGTFMVSKGGDMDYPIIIDPTNFADGVPESNVTHRVGTFASQNVSNTANTTAHAAVALWHFAQTWFEEFPMYKPHDEKISLWTESYGGKYGPGVTSFFAQQNEKIANGTISGPGTHYIHLDTLGIINGCIDSKYQTESYITMLRNNTYGINAMNDTMYHGTMYHFMRPGGGLDAINECQRIARDRDPNEIGYDEDVLRACGDEAMSFENFTMSAFEEADVGWFDITHPAKDPFPGMYFIGFLNQEWVQRALGVPVNHTWASPAVARAFRETGDMQRGGLVEDIAYLLDGGLKVALVYGDRDYACNWIGGEQVSINIGHKLQDEFLGAGYTPLILGDPYSPPFTSYGQTRQHGNFSFTRVYQAGHMVPSYQPEAAHEIFKRSLRSQDIATGSVDLRSIDQSGKGIYKTEGPSDTWWMKNEVFPVPPGLCYVLSPDSCTDVEWEMVINGTGIVKNWILVGVEGGMMNLEDGLARFGTGSQQVLSADADAGVEAGRKMRRALSP